MRAMQFEILPPHFYCFSVFLPFSNFIRSFAIAFICIFFVCSSCVYVCQLICLRITLFIRIHTSLHLFCCLFSALILPSVNIGEQIQISTKNINLNDFFLSFSACVPKGHVVELCFRHNNNESPKCFGLETKGESVSI